MTDGLMAANGDESLDDPLKSFDCLTVTYVLVCCAAIHQYGAAVVSLLAQPLANSISLS